MGLKDNLKAIKNELNTEEKFIENFIKSERFVRKYKFYILAVLGVLIIGFLSHFLITKIKEHQVKQGNQIYASLLQNPNDKNLLEELKNKNINLYTLFLMDKNFNDPNNADLQNKLKQSYNAKQTNVLLKNIIALALNDKSIFLKNYEQLMDAYGLLKQNKIEEANVLLSKIPNNSNLNQIAKNLKHYQGISQ